MNTDDKTTKTGQPLQSKPFAALPTLIPAFENGAFTGGAYKAELVLLRGVEGGARLHVWFGHDQRPHNHPWKWIDCKVLCGGYSAVEYTPNGSGSYNERRVELNAGDPEHRLNHETHHQIVEIKPGTVTVMSFGPTIGDGKQWGNLVKTDEGFRYEANTMQPGFLDALRHLNPHLRPEGWNDPYAEMPVPNVQELMAAAGL